nr:hypothetical protein GCM10017611_53680 [Rhodococcus wratislaviensis]
MPASCCGLVGLKPSRDRIPCGPLVGEAGFGHIYEFALTRTIRDTAHLLDAVAAPPVGEKYTAPAQSGRYADTMRADPGRLRVALTTCSRRSRGPCCRRPRRSPRSTSRQHSMRNTG